MPETIWWSGMPFRVLGRERSGPHWLYTLEAKEGPPFHLWVEATD